MSTKAQRQFDELLAAERGKRFPDPVGYVFKKAGYRKYMARRLEWALETFRADLNDNSTTDERLAIVAADLKVTYTPPAADR
jgi:hypothetical protein